MVHLVEFALSDMVRMSAALRTIGEGAESLEQVAKRVVGYLNDQLRPVGSPASDLVLARFYKTHPFADLPPDVQHFALQNAAGDVSDSTRCLTLLASQGIEPQWNDAARSQQHRSIALSDEQVVTQAPMIAQLIHQFGLSIGDVVEPDPELFVELEEKTYNVFHVPVADGSPYIPAQGFVEQYGVASALGFGGMLLTGDLFCVVLFSRDPISAEVASLMRPLALAVKIAAAPFAQGPIFEQGSSPQSAPALADPVSPTAQLLEVHESIALEQATRLEAALASAQQLSQRLSALISVARLLADAQNEEEILEVIAQQGVSLLGAQGTVLALIEPDGKHVRALTTEFLDERVQAQVSNLPIDFPLPMVHTARTGESLFISDRTDAVALFPDAETIYLQAAAEASCTVVLHHGQQRLGSLAVAWSEPRGFDNTERQLLEALSAMCGQALGRVRVRAVERENAAAAMRMSETLQRSMLTRPPDTHALRIAVRYRPAARQAQIGGDWYDAFRTPGGATALVIGDVTGHDRAAAATMGQVRNLLRATDYAIDDTPAAVLAALETAMQGLEVDSLATAILAHVHTNQGQTGSTLGWCNAGHLPPVLRYPDGATVVLDRHEPDLLLGLAQSRKRSDHEQHLPDGSVLVLYTDGLVERRNESIDVGIERLRRVIGELGDLPIESLCDALLSHLTLDEPEDDLALLAVHVGETN